MIDPQSIGGPGGPQRADPPKGPLPSERVSDGGAAFRALLEKLDDQTREMRQTNQSVGRPDELAGAAEEARASIQDALSLKDQLLEAYRATQQRSSGPDESS